MFYVCVCWTECGWRHRSQACPTADRPRGWTLRICAGSDWRGWAEELQHCFCSRETRSANFLPQFLPTQCYSITGASCGPVCVCHKTVFCRNGWTNWARFGIGAIFHLSCTVLKGNTGISKNKGTFLWNFVPNSRLSKCCFSISIVETCYQLSSTRWTLGGSEPDKLDHHRSTILTVPLSFNTWMLVYHSIHQALSTAWLHHAGFFSDSWYL